MVWDLLIRAKDLLEGAIIGGFDTALPPACVGQF